MGSSSYRQWQDLTTAEFDSIDRERTIVVLPVAAIEQHGPHLPLSVDAVINDGVLQETWKILPENLSVLALPAQPVGWSDEHAAFPGTLSLDAETLIRVWTDIAASVAAAGFRKFVLFNSHGGQSEITRVVARKLRLEHGMLAVTVNWYSLVDLKGMFDAVERVHGIHAGAVETSVMMHLRPDLVRDEQVGEFTSSSIEIEESFQHLRATGKVSFGWATQDLHASGAVGHAALADAEKGREIVAQAARGFVEVLQDVDGFALSRLEKHP